MLCMCGSVHAYAVCLWTYLWIVFVHVCVDCVATLWEILQKLFQHVCNYRQANPVFNFNSNFVQLRLKEYKIRLRNKEKEIKKNSKWDIPLAIFGLRRPRDPFMTSFTLLRSKNRKDPKTSEELKAGGTKNIKREMEKKGEKWDLFKKKKKVKHLSWLTLADVRAYANLSTNKQNKNSDWGTNRCARTKTPKTYWNIGRAKGSKIRWIYRAKDTWVFLLHPSWHFHSDRARYSSPASSQLTNTHTVRMNSSRSRGSELFWRKKNRTEYGNKKKRKRTLEKRWKRLVATDK